MIKAFEHWGWVLAIVLILVGFFGAGLFWIAAQQATGVTPPLIDTTEVKVVPAQGEAGYTAVEEFCRDTQTEVKPLTIPDITGYELRRTLNAVMESITVFINPRTGDVIQASYYEGAKPPVNAVITEGARKCFQDRVKP